MCTLNYLSNSDVAMLKVPVLLATAEFEHAYASVYMCTVKPSFLNINASDGHQPAVNIR